MKKTLSKSNHSVMKKTLLSFMTVSLLTACGTTSVQEGGKAAEGFQSVEDLRVVDCLLPGQVNRLGDLTYVSERRATRTTAVDCNIRGGEYVAYDRADYRSALNVWLKSAEQGNPEAQTYVGEIFEKGLGQNVDYKTAARWYERAAKQGYKRAIINLGFLYEKGLGVEQDLTKSLNLYRTASGGEDELMFSSDASAEIEKARNELQTQLSDAKRELKYLNKQLQQAEAEKQAQLKQRDNTAELSKANEEVDALRRLYEKSQIQLESLNQKFASLPSKNYRSYSEVDLLQPLKLESKDTLKFKDMNFGRYFALIIGNQDYLYLDDLQSPQKDAERLKEVLETRYGFSTVSLFNASEKEILNAFNELNNQIGPKDNLLVFYAGHGNLSDSADSKRKRGYWLPANAEPGVLTNWISNSVISDHLDRIRARSVLVISDSCFAGNLASEKSAFLLGGMSSSLSEKSIRLGISRRSRIVISSGGEKPVLDGGAGEHSIFANALIKLLENNDGILRENMLFSQVAVNVRRQAKVMDIEQTPEMRPIRAAGHEGGDFYFVPVSTVADIERDTSQLAAIDM